MTHDELEYTNQETQLPVSNPKTVQSASEHQFESHQSKPSLNLDLKLTFLIRVEKHINFVAY